MAPIYQASQADKTHKQALAALKSSRHLWWCQVACNLHSNTHRELLSAHQACVQLFPIQDNNISSHFSCMHGLKHHSVRHPSPSYTCVPVWQVCLQIKKCFSPQCKVEVLSGAAFQRWWDPIRHRSRQDECWCETPSIRLMPGFVFMAKARLSSRITPALCK